MKNSLALGAMIDRFNRTVPEDDHIHLNWGREGSRSTWYINGKYGMDLKTGLRFYEIIDCVEDAIRIHEEWLRGRADMRRPA